MEGDSVLEFLQRSDDLGGRTQTPTLEELLCELPDDLAVPVRWVRHRLELDRRRTSGVRRLDQKATPISAAESHAELSAEEYGNRRVPQRTAEWVRDACRAGTIPGARKDGLAWLIPVSALAQEQHRARISRGRLSRDGIGKPAVPRQDRGAQAHARWGADT